MGTDTLAALVTARRYYNAEMAGFSIPAAEHSTMTSWGQDHEVDAFANMLEQYGGEGRALSVVSDSYDIWNAIDHLWGEQLRDQVRQMGGTLVVRPDSGEPTEVVPEVVERLMAGFGEETNRKGYRVLPDCVRVIQGDGVNDRSIEAILKAMKARRLSAENLTFGMGGALLQKLNRDTQQFAMKASAICVNGQWRGIHKEPVTNPEKRSKHGRLALIRDRDDYRTVRREELGNAENALVTVFRNGELLREWDFEEVRRRANDDSQ